MEVDGNLKHRVVILGGGFGGLYAAKALKKLPARVTVIDRRNFHLFQPLLYQVATGGLSPGDIASPLRSVLRRQTNTEVLLDEAIDIDPEQRRVVLADGEVAYNTLVVATGARHSYFGNNDWEPYAPGLKTIEDATEIRRRFLLAFEAAEKEPDAERRQAWLTFVVVGAGPTGVELAGAMAEIARDTLRQDFRSIRPENSRILLLDGSPRVLPPYPPELSATAERDLIKLGVRPLTGVVVTGVDENAVTVRTVDGHTERVEAKTVLWAAGVEPSPLARVLAERAGAPLDRAGRVMVQPDLTVPGHPEIFVIGDLAHALDKDSKPLPGVAPVAMQQGRYVANVIDKRLRGDTVEPFRYRNKGNLATIGRASAVADFGRIRLSGWFAWLLWLFVHLMYLVGFQNRVLVFIQWGFHYFTFHRGARLITAADRGYMSQPSPAAQPTKSQELPLSR